MLKCLKTNSNNYQSNKRCSPAEKSVRDKFPLSLSHITFLHPIKLKRSCCQIRFLCWEGVETMNKKSISKRQKLFDDEKRNNNFHQSFDMEILSIFSIKTFSFLKVFKRLLYYASLVEQSHYIVLLI